LRSLVLVLILVKLFSIPTWAYFFVVMAYGLGLLFLGKLADKINLIDELQDEYYRRSGGLQKDLKKVVNENGKKEN